MSMALPRCTLRNVFLALALLCLPAPAAADPADTGRLKTELSALQRDIVGIARRIKDKESKLSDNEDKLAALQQQRGEKKREGERKQQELEAALQGMIRLSQTPPEAVIAMPGDYYDTLKTAKILGLVSNTVRAEADNIRQQLTELTVLENKINAAQQALRMEKRQLEEDKTALDAKLANRGALQASLYSESQKESALNAKRAGQSGDVKGLIASLETSREKEEAADVQTYRAPETPPGAPTQSAAELRSFAKAKGRISPPVAGRMIARFGEQKDAGHRLKGMTLATPDGAQVSAPFDGEVVYSGAFLDYGNMVILRHSDGFHTLLAGLAKIACVPGQFLLEGEPIGAMGTLKNDVNTLYVELRKNGKPVDPINWMGGALVQARQ